MIAPKLTPELIALIHHVELNKSGWMDETIRELILTKLAVADRVVDLDGLQALLSEETSKEIGRERIGRQVERLVKSFDLTSPSAGHFKLSEVNRKRYRERIETAERLEEVVESLFEGVCEGLPEAINRRELWARFRSSYLNPLLAQLGATTFSLFTGTGDIIDLPRFEVFLAPYPAVTHEAINTAVESFLRSGNEDVRSYILGSLNAFYFIEAAGLNEETVESLRKRPGDQVEFVIFADTNFLLTLLGFKDVLEDAAQTINDFIVKLSGRVKVRFFVLPVTVKEAQAVLAGKREKLGRLHLSTRQFSGLQLDGLDDIDLKYIDAFRSTGITADAYFGPFIDDLIICLQDRGLVFDNADLSKYSTRQDVVDDILFLQEYQVQHKVEVQRSYEQIQHDMILWHYANDRRPPYVESPSQATYWVITLDSRLRAFDAKKKHANEIRVQVCLHPATFVQMLQFWIPRTPEFETAILSSLRIPFLARDFDTKAESVTLEILGALSKFENIGIIKPETINELLTSSALRDKISSNRDRDATFKLVRDALIEKHALTERELERTRKAKEKVERLATQTQEHLEAQLLRQTEAYTSVTEELNAVKAKAENDSKTRIERRHFVWKRVVFPLLAYILLSPGLAIFLPQTIWLGRWSWAGAIVAICLIVHIYLLDSFGDENEFVKDSKAFQRFQKFKNLLTIVIAVTWAIALAIYSDEIKAMFHAAQQNPEASSTGGARKP